MRVPPPHAAARRRSELRADAVWQTLEALRGVGDPRPRAALFDRAVREAHHAATLSAQAQAAEAVLAPFAPPMRERLFDPDAGLAAFEAAYWAREANGSGDGPEQRARAFERLVAVLGSEGEARRAVRASRRASALARLGRSAGALGAAVGGAAFTALFLVAGPLARAGRGPRRLGGSAAAGEGT